MITKLKIVIAIACQWYAIICGISPIDCVSIIFNILILWNLMHQTWVGNYYFYILCNRLTLKINSIRNSDDKQVLKHSSVHETALVEKKNYGWKTSRAGNSILVLRCVSDPTTTCATVISYRAYVFFVVQFIVIIIISLLMMIFNKYINQDVGQPCSNKF